LATDHSQSYKGFGVRAIGHRLRLRAIFKELKSMDIPPMGAHFCDLGCSNGFITQKIQAYFNFNSAVGLDHEFDNLTFAQRSYPEIEFRIIDLNKPPEVDRTFDLVTCFETLEHVGNLQNSIRNILSRIAPGGKCLISVPIEHGLRGFLKYLVKKIVFRYSVSELGVPEHCYFRLLLGGDRISKSRPKADGYGTHFGFDYRDVDDLLVESGVNFIAYNNAMTRFYRISG